MCGIAGLKLFNNIPSKTEEALLWSALKKQQHRGPDNTKIHTVGKALLGHNRLSIIDTNERSHQPFFDITGRYTLVFNGEIYNYKELKSQLKEKGIEFHTTSDTEVLFQLLIQDKEKAFEKLRGCFAFAFYDQQEDYLLLGRDRMGINPLLYAIDEDKLIFGSELVVFDDFISKKVLNEQALGFYFQYTYIPAPLTVLENVQKLLPGHYLKVEQNQVSIHRYWDPKNENGFQGTYEEAKKILREKVEFAVTSQLEADVPVGTFLSGGVDSSIVSAIAKKHKADLHTFSVSFGDQAQYDESKYALDVANHIGSIHHVIRLTKSDFTSHFQEILDSFDEPFADSSAIAMWFLARETASVLKVALSGDGADELFAGYNKHAAYLKARSSSMLKKRILEILSPLIKPVIASKNPKKWHKISKFIQLSKLKWPDSYHFLASNIGEAARKKLLLKNTTLHFPHAFGEDSLTNFLHMDQLFVLSNDMLKKVDVMSMAHSLEVRTPFMDKDLVKFANALPEEFKRDKNTGKRILKETFSDLLPEHIFTRPKQGFEVPIHSWIRESWEELIPKKWFSEKFILEQQLFSLNSVKDLRERFFNNEGTSSQEIWAYLVFQNWYCKHYA